MTGFLSAFKFYLFEIIPALAVGFLISGVINEFLPSDWISKYLKGKGIKGILYSTFLGTIAPVCCWGSLPIAISLYMRGATLGPVLAVLVATPATSISALMVTARLMGIKTAIFIFISVIFMGVIIGVIGNKLHVNIKRKDQKEENCPHCGPEAEQEGTAKRTFSGRVISILRFAYVKMPKSIGKEVLIGIAVAAGIKAYAPIGEIVQEHLTGNIAYVFSIVFGTLMYICSTMSVPLVDALVKNGLALGPGLVLLLVGPITSYGTILVLKKEFGAKVLGIYLALVCGLSILAANIYIFLNQ